MVKTGVNSELLLFTFSASVAVTSGLALTPGFTVTCGSDRFSDVDGSTNDI